MSSRTPKASLIISSDESATRRRLDSAAARYGFAALSAMAGLALAIPLASRVGPEISLLFLFIAVTAGSVFGGFAAGLVSTLLTAVGATGLSAGPSTLSAAELRLLLAEGVLMSFLGGGLRALQGRARFSETANRKLEQQILEIGDEERQRIGNDLHDGLGQHLTGLSLLTESIVQQIAGGLVPREEELETVTRMVSEAIGWTRDVARNLSPVTLERDGLVAAMEELAINAGQLLAVNCDWEYEGATLHIDRKRALHLYRIAQEAVSNSVKHGKAKNVRVRLAESDSMLKLLVVDDGSGLSEKTMINPGLGLRIMEYRARMVGAALKVERASPAGGTIVTCTCPTNEAQGKGTR